MLKTPNLFIVGAPKCGTTSLHYYLNQHPDIFLCKPKEPNYYNTDLIRTNRIKREDYFALFDNDNAKYIGEATPLYLMSKDAPINIKKDSPNAKIIIAIRKPSDLLFSAYYQNKYNLIEEASSFEEAINGEEKRKKTLVKTKTGEPIDRLIYSRFVNFTTQISRYIETFGKENVHVIIFDDLKRNTEVEVRKVLDFLGIDNKAEIDFSVQNVSKTNKSELIAKHLHSPPSFLRKLVVLVVPTSVTNKIYRYLKKANTDTKQKNKPRISPETEKVLIEKYIPEVENIEKLLDVNLSNWIS